MVIEKVSERTPLPEKVEHPIAHQNWVSAPHVKAGFSIRHDGTSVYLYYQVKEPQVRAVNTGYNSNVWEDSCVEFFLSFDGDAGYYNFEFNAIGTILGAYGTDRHQRVRLSDNQLSQVVTTPSLGRDPIENLDHPTRWSMKVVIPISVLQFTKMNTLSGINGHGNFYKCGDKLEHPHYLSWQPVGTSSPDFHTPRYFGPLSFL
jgi:hypothetical protein